LIAARAALDGPQDEKLRRVVGDPDELLAVRKGVAKPADSDHRIGGDEQDGSKGTTKQDSQTEESLAFLSGNT